jgi:hypothetical protein
MMSSKENTWWLGWPLSFSLIRKPSKMNTWRLGWPLTSSPVRMSSVEELADTFLARVAS